MTHGSYRIFWLCSLPELATWQPRLNRFFETVGSHNPFARCDRLKAYAEAFQLTQTLRLCLLADPASYDIQALLLLKQNRGVLNDLLPRLDCIGNTPHVTDANQLLLHPESDPDQVIPELAHALLNAPFRWSYLHWQFMEPESHCQVLARSMAAHVNRAQIVGDLPRPVLPLPETEAAYIKARSSRVKKFVNNKQNRLKRDFPDQPLSVRWVKPEETGAIMDWFFPTYLAYWDMQGIKTQLHRYPSLIAFYRHCLEKGLFRLSGTFVGDEVACVFIGYDLPNQTYLLHMTCFNDKFGAYSPGILHNNALVGMLIEAGYKTLDMGLGDLEYKRYFTQTKLPTYQLIVQRTALAFTVNKTVEGLKQLKQKWAARQSEAPNDPEGATSAEETDESTKPDKRVSQQPEQETKEILS